MDYTDFPDDPPVEASDEIFEESEEDIELLEEEETPSAGKTKPGILTKEREEEIALDMERGKHQAIDAALRCKCMEKSLDNLLDWVMRENGRVWRYLEDPREDGVGETSMLDAINDLAQVRNKLGKFGDRLSKSFLEISRTKDPAAVKNIRRRVRRAFKHRQETFTEELGYSVRIEFFDDLSQRFKDGISVLFKGIDEADFIREYGASTEEFREISQEFFSGERLFQKSREELILANQRLVIYFARKYQDQGVDLVDLIGEGNIGLLRAVERFDPGKGSRLATYATWWIKHNLNRAVANQGSTIRVPGHVREEKNRILKVITEMTITESKSPTFYDVAQRLDIPIERVHHILRRTQGTISIDKPLGTDTEDETLQKLLPDADVLTPEEEVSKAFDKVWVKELLLELTPRERLIIEMRYGLTGKDAMTLQEVGAQLDITRERVRQLQTKAESKLFKLARKLGYFNR